MKFEIRTWELKQGNTLQSTLFLYHFKSFSDVPANVLSQFSQIIDSIMALFRVDFCGRGELADRQQKLAQMLSRLQKLSEGELYD